MKCDVCGKDVDDINVCCSTCGPITIAYCNDCLQEGLEPYDFVVAYLAEHRSLETLSDYYKGLVQRVCKANNKTIEQFFADCKDLDEKSNCE